MTIALALPRLATLENRTLATTQRWALIISTVVVDLTFFVTGHDFNVSLAESFTQNADEMEIAATGGNLLRRLAFVVFACWGLVLITRSKQPLRIKPILAFSIALLLATAGLSFLWADDPGMCLRRLSVLFCCVIGAAGLSRTFDLRDISWLTVWMVGFLAAIGILAELRLGTFRPWAGDYRFSGTVHPNTQGPGLAMLVLASFGLARESVRSRGWLWAAFAAGMVLLILTKSRSATAAIVASLGAVMLVQTSLRTKLAAGFGLLLAAGLGLWLFWVAGIDPLHDFRDVLLLGRSEESDTLSGRAFLWPELQSFAEQRIWLGYGYESFWTPAHIDTISSALGWGLREAHNSYLELLLWLGIVGLGLMGAVVLTSVLATLAAFRARRDVTTLFPLGLIVFGLINAGLESGMVVVNVVPFILGACLLRLALFTEANSHVA